MSVQCVRYCKVLSIKDDTDSDLIQVRIEPEDNGIKNDKKLPYAYPLLPKAFHVKPKVGEGVLVFVAIADDANSQRYYIGPVISQDQKLWYDDYQYAPTFMRGHEYDANVAPSGEKKCNGILPNDNDICVRGRKNAEMQITDDDVRIKSGVKLVEESNKYDMKFNEYDPAYIKIKYHPGGLIKKEDVKENNRNIGSQKGNFTGYDTDNENFVNKNEIKQVNSTVTLVADKINLLQNNSEENSFVTTDRENLIDDNELKRAITEAYKLPYGEKLVDILTVFINAFVKHTHRFSMLPPVEANGIPELNEKKAILLDNKELLSDTVRIN